MLSASAGTSLVLLKEMTFFFPGSKTLEFLCPCSTVIPCVCLGEECALGSFQHLWDRAGRRTHSESCSRMARSHPLDQSLTNKDCSVCARTSTRILQSIPLADSHYMITLFWLSLSLCVLCWKLTQKKTPSWDVIKRRVVLNTKVSVASLCPEWQQTNGEKLVHTPSVYLLCKAMIGVAEWKHLGSDF